MGVGHTQYRNTYQKRVAFDFSVKGTQQEVVDHVKTIGSQYRTEIKPGEIDPALWGSYSSSEKIWEVVGHLRFLDGDDIDSKGTFNNCDGGGNRGQTDYICRNEPKTDYNCSNFVHPPPAAFVFWSKMTGAGVTSAARQPTPQDCLDLYKYFSDNRKSDDPVAMKQALDAAQVFQRQCKMTEDQKAGVGQAITSSQNRLQRIQSNPSQNNSPSSELLNGTEAVKKGDIFGLKQKIIENLKQNIRPYQKSTTSAAKISTGLVVDFSVTYADGKVDTSGFYMTPQGTAFKPDFKTFSTAGTLNLRITGLKTCSNYTRVGQSTNADGYQCNQ